MNLETVIGLEIHLQIKTKSKMFCDCSNRREEREPNSNVCPICLGHPGSLPAANKQAVEFGAMMALALHCQINKKSVWARKNYFYPDLPKGYQISQFAEPLAIDGHLTVLAGGEEIRIGIERLHLEEDAAKNFHSADKTLVDYNRAGAPLMEIVTKPEFKFPAEAKAFLQELRLIARYLKVSSADMEKGHLRCDANISLRKVGEDKLYPKTEIKNLNSFRSVERALEYEIKRQTELWNQGMPPSKQATRGWDEQALKTREQRDKEESADYRYFSDPDLPPLFFTSDKIEEIQSKLPELPRDKRIRLEHEYGLKAVDARIIVEDQNVADYFERVMTEARAWLESLADPLGTAEEIWQLNRQKLTKLVSGWLLSELFKLMKEDDKSILDIKISPENFAEFIALVYQRKVNSSSAQIILKKMYLTGGDPSQIMAEEDLGQAGDEAEMAKVVEKIINENFDQVMEYKNGKLPLMKYFVGLGMKAMKGKADPEKLGEMFSKKLSG